MQKSSGVSKPLDAKQNSRKLPRRYVIALWLIGIFSSASLGFSVYTYYRLPNNIANYVSTHKADLKGDKGDKGAMGPAGMNGATGANGASGTSPGGSAGFTCNTWGTSSQYTTCY